MIGLLAPAWLAEIGNGPQAFAVSIRLYRLALEEAPATLSPEGKVVRHMTKR